MQPRPTLPAISALPKPTLSIQQPTSSCSATSFIANSFCSALCTRWHTPKAPRPSTCPSVHGSANCPVAIALSAATLIFEYLLSMLLQDGSKQQRSSSAAAAAAAVLLLLRGPPCIHQLPLSDSQTATVALVLCCLRRLVVGLLKKERWSGVGEWLTSLLIGPASSFAPTQAPIASSRYYPTAVSIQKLAGPSVCRQSTHGKADTGSKLSRDQISN